jgi:hypothetical protein
VQVVGGVERTDEPNGEDLAVGVFVPLFRGCKTEIKIACSEFLVNLVIE